MAIVYGNPKPVKLTAGGASGLADNARMELELDSTPYGSAAAPAGRRRGVFAVARRYIGGRADSSRDAGSQRHIAFNVGVQINGQRRCGLHGLHQPLRQIAQVLTRADVFFEQGQERSNGWILVRCFIGTGDDDL